MIGCTRSNLHVVASDKGLVVGRISFYEDGDFIDCTKMGVGGKAIPPYIDKIENVESDAEFILLVEKEAAYMRMAVSATWCLQLILLHYQFFHRFTSHSWLIFTGRQILSKISVHSHYSQGTTRCSHTNVPFSHHIWIKNSCVSSGGFWSIWTQDFISVYVGE